MGFVPDFQNDLFISYCHADNASVPGSRRHWITDLENLLRNRLQIQLGKPVATWRDEKIQGNDYFDDTIRAELLYSACLLCVLSPSYVGSTWCLQELNEFSAAADRSTGRVFEGHSRIFIAVKFPVKPGLHPEALRGLDGYHFCEETPGPLGKKEYDPTSKKAEPVINQLVSELCGILKAMKRKKAISVYIAETTPDLAPEREAVKLELALQEHEILPKPPSFAPHAPDLENAVRRCMEQCRLSIHPFSSAYWDRSGGKDAWTLVETQMHVAAGIRSNPPLFRLIWAPQKLTDNKMEQDLYRISYPEDAKERTDLINGKSVEEFKIIVEEKIEAIRKCAAMPLPQGDRRLVYLLCSYLDHQDAFDRLTAVVGLDLDVRIPSFCKDPKKAHEEHQALLGSCDAVILYHGRSPEIWFEQQRRDLIKKNRYCQGCATVPKAVLIAPPAAEKERNGGPGGAMVIRWRGDAPPIGLAEFLDLVRSAPRRKTDAE